MKRLSMPMVTGCAAMLVCAASLAHAGHGSTNLTWQPCGVAAECTTISVPLDWNDPKGAQITLAFARHRATDPSRRLGVLFFMNGQGASAMDYVAARSGADRFPSELVERFDIVGIDPRGGGVNPGGQVLDLPVASTRLNCQLNAHSAQARYFPENRQEFEALVAHNRQFAASCGPLLGYMDAASHAQDVEAVRRALGEPRISWLSWTTGSQVGLEYASRYPQRVRAMVLDQPAMVELPTRKYVLDHAAAVQDQFDRFVAWCERTERCIYHGQDLRAAFAALIEQARAVPVPAVGPTAPPADEGAPIDHPFTADELLFLAEQLLEIGDIEIVPGLTGFDALAYGIFEASFGSTSVLPGSYLYSIGWSGFWNPYRVRACLDLDIQVPNYAVFRTYERAARRVAPDMRGISQAWDGFAGCIGWPESRHAGSRRLSYSRSLPPILLVSSRHSAWAPYEHARMLERRLPGARLLTYEGDTHIVYLSSQCAVGWMVDYLVRGKLPPRGTSCPQEGLLAGDD